MKSNAIIRIIIFSIVIFILIAVLGAGIISKLFINKRNSDTTALIPAGEGTVTSSYSISADKIKDIQVEWVSGEITIVPAETNEITVVETGRYSDKEKMVVLQNGNKLTIQYCEESVNFSFFSFGISMDTDKDLTITVPQDWVCNELEVDSASAEIVVNNLTINELDFNTASGRINVNQSAVGEMSLETVSGDIEFTGTLDTLSCHSVSANCNITVTNVPKSIEMEGVSGDLELNLPSECGFTASVETVSGKFSSEFATVSQNGSHIYGDGACRIEMEGVSGNVRINQQ